MIVYKITSLVNSKVYIGQTISKFSLRKGLHLFHLRNNKHPNPHLQSSFNKYGESNFKFDIIQECSSIEELNIKEKEYINIYNSNDRTKGYNIRIGGLNENLSIEHKDKISKALIGNTNGSFGRGKTKIRSKGMVHTEESKLQISNQLKGRRLNKIRIENSRLGHFKQVLQYDLQGNFIKEHQSLIDAAKDTGANKSVISLCLFGKKQTSVGFIWKRKTIPGENITV